MPDPNPNPDPNPVPAPAPAPAPAPDWTAGLVPEAKLLVETKGYKSPNDLAAAYISAEKAIGADKIALPGKDAKPEDWDAVWSKLGRPDKPEGYRFVKPEKLPEGFVYSDDTAKAFSGWAHEAGLTPGQAQKLHDKFVAAQAERHSAEAAARAAGKTDGMAALKTEWGAATDTKVDLAKRAARWAGGDELVDHLEQTGLGNHLPLVKALAKIGAAMGETMADGMGAKPQGFAKTPAEATAEIARLQGEAIKDRKHPLNDKFHPEHQAMVDKLESLHKQAFPEPVA